MPVDHSKRVSPKENVDAFKAWLRECRDGLMAWVRTGPARRFLRNRNVLTLLGFAGVALSVAALAMVVDVGKAQVVAAEYPRQHRADLFSNWWFVLGAIAFGIGIVLAAIAISANNSQAAARRRFPDLLIGVYVKRGVEEFPLGHELLISPAVTGREP